MITAAIEVSNGRAWDLEDDVFKIRCFLFHSTYDEMRTVMNLRGWGIEPRERIPLASTLVHRTDDGAYHQLIWLPLEWSHETLECLNTLVHECQHVTFKGLIHRGVCANQDDHEPFCYYIGSLFEKCLGALKA